MHRCTWELAVEMRKHLRTSPLEILFQLSKLQLATLKLLNVSLHMMDNSDAKVNNLANSLLGTPIQFRLQSMVHLLPKPAFSGSLSILR